MNIEIRAAFGFHLPEPTDVLLQFEAALTDEQALLKTDTWIPQGPQPTRIAAHDDIGERIWVHAEGDCRVDYSAVVNIDRKNADMARLQGVLPRLLPGATVQYLFDSRYCPASSMQDFVFDTFGKLDGGEKIIAMRDWIASNIAYEPGSSDAFTTALDTFESRRGICRDFAHVMIGFARAAAIPARYVSCYAPGVNPPDFHAIAEVFLADPQSEQGGTWQMVDATGMADPAQTATIGVGRDAADVSFMTVFGQCRFDFSEVRVAAHKAG